MGSVVSSCLPPNSRFGGKLNDYSRECIEREYGCHMDALLKEAVEKCYPYTQKGALASYIPELTKADKDALGICLTFSDGTCFCAGNDDTQFTIQSIIKPILLLLALIDNGEEYVRSRVGLEATGKAFDAINASDQKLDSEHINPMVNMGAIAMCALIHGNTYAEKFQRLLALTRKLADNPKIELNESVYLSEKRTGNKNRALAYLLKAHGFFPDEVEDVLDFYFKACSIQVTCRDLASIARVLANHGKKAQTEEQIIPSQFAYYINAVLVTCGMYNGSGNFAVDVGIPAKSGVGGGIMAVAPQRMGIGIFSPALDSKGNSLAGIQLLRYLSQKMHLSVF